MAIEFNNVGNTPVQHRVKQEKAGGETSTSASQGKNPARNDVELSQQVQQLKNSALGSNVDTAKIERIKAEISEGRYHIDPVKLAENFVALESAISEVHK
ncbi:MAG: flagellar biosynthesis anti-sigma factor FlgM [Pseudomonadales bacterium]|nr:flagellar biosynthesis anti-sigma factor FlgM [Pseudomonadales bacterium]